MSARSGWATNLTLAVPLAWPGGRVRTTARSFGDYRHPVSHLNAGDDILDATRRLRAQFNARGIEAVELSTNRRLRPMADGEAVWADIEEADPVDPGAAVRFRLDGENFVLTCDMWTSVANNVAAIAARVDAMGWQHQIGVTAMIDALRGYAAPAAHHLEAAE